MVSLVTKFEALGPVISKIITASGAAGASIGVLSHGELHTANFGYQDLENKIPPTADTVYNLASLSKSFTASAVGILVHEGKFKWDTPVVNILPDFKHYDTRVQNEVTVLDALSHSLGLAPKNALWLQNGAQLLLKYEDTLPFFSYLEVVEPLRSKWLYINWGYELAAKIVEHTTNKPLLTFISERILKPLHLNSTYTRAAADIPREMFARPYQASPDGPPTLCDPPTIGDGTFMTGAAGLKASVNDLLKYYQAVLETYNAEQAGVEPSPDRPLREMTKLLSPHIALDADSKYTQGYGAGWAIAELPAPLGSIGINGMFISEMPVVGKGAERKRIWYHNGSLTGFFSSVHILPDDETIIVVLVNSLARNDCADWLGQVIVEALVDNSDKNDYVALAAQTSASYVQQWSAVQDELKKRKSSDSNDRDIQQYVGKYYNKPGNFVIDVRRSNSGLSFSFQDYADQKFDLEPFGIDTFGWPLTEAESRARKRWPDLDANVYIFYFKEGSSGEIEGLQWKHDWAVPDGEMFYKDSDQSLAGASINVDQKRLKYPQKVRSEL